MIPGESESVPYQTSEELMNLLGGRRIDNHLENDLAFIPRATTWAMGAQRLPIFHKPDNKSGGTYKDVITASSS